MFAAHAINSLYDVALALAYPQGCAICEGSVESRFDGAVCGACWMEVRLLTGQDTLCWKCGALTLASIAPTRREDVRCHHCDDAAFTAARACGLYQGALRAAVIELKRTPHVPGRLVQLMVKACRQPPLDQSTLIVPVPLHPLREQERGFNQALVLARELSRHTQWPVVENCLARIAQTERHRAGMDARARQESVKDAFALITTRLIEGESILLIDDVYTSGATVSACATVLRVGGAKQILALTLARPLGQ